MAAETDANPVLVAITALVGFDSPVAVLGLAEDRLQDQQRPPELVAGDVQVGDAGTGGDPQPAGLVGLDPAEGVPGGDDEAMRAAENGRNRDWGGTRGDPFRFHDGSISGSFSCGESSY